MLQLPLDLTDVQLMSEGAELERAVASLDEHGWNQNSIVQHCTFSRLSATNAMIAEDILEISMGKITSREEFISRAAEIERKAADIYSEFPKFLQVNHDEFPHPNRAPIELLYLAYIRVDDLNHHFLLQRTLVKKIGADNSKLVDIAQKMFSFIVKIINHRDMFREFQIDMIQLLTMNGIPSAAVIAMELLHQEQNPASHSALTNPLPRSGTIQDLSVFVACLGTIKPTANGFTSCNRGRQFLKKILDTILDLPPAGMSGDVLSGYNLGDYSLANPMFQTGNDGDFMRWLDTMEWESDTFINFS